jgi:hypothetical protein
MRVDTVPVWIFHHMNIGHTKRDEAEFLRVLVQFVAHTLDKGELPPAAGPGF